MSMFDNYANLNSNSIPYNITVILPAQRVEYSDEIPRKEYNVWGDFIGYSWNYGDTFNLQFHIEPVISVEQDAIVYTATNDAPTTATVGTFNQRAYNTVDLKVWVCKTYDQTVYVWEEQNAFTYPVNGTKAITLLSDVSLLPRKVSVDIQDFRREVIDTFDVDWGSTISVPIDKELSAKLLKGLYYCVVTVFTDSSSTFNSECTLIVK